MGNSERAFDVWAVSGDSWIAVSASSSSMWRYTWRWKTQ